LVATPIGNLEDITLRALRILKQVGHIASEDTRHTGKLLHHYNIATPQISYHEHNKQARLRRLMQELETGDVALVADAGMPGLSDPGFELVQAAIAAGHAVSPIPGASAPVAALVASGLPSDAFLYLGYLPRQAGARRSLLESLAAEPRTLVFFEVPHRLRAALADLATAFGNERPAAACRELTKLHEDIQRGTLASLTAHFGDQAPRGEFTLVVAGVPAGSAWDEARVRGELARRRARGDTPTQAARHVAQASGWARRDVYRIALEDG
jgi:16S rRNA (cytidine1402-2'-O)-methyltransferase